jgi:hypothetical protein
MADTFDSTGEMSLVVYTVQDLLVRKKRLPEIVLVVKSGRAWQTASLCRQLLNQLKLNHIPVSVRTYEAPVTELGTPGRAGFKTLYLAYLRAVTRFLNLCD